MGNYKFKQKEDKFIWTNGKIKLIFSHPKFQAHDEYMYVNSEKDILYFYYKVSIYVNYEKYIEGAEVDKNVWKLISSHSVYDFPGIFQLKDMLDILLHEEIPLENYRKFYFYHNGKQLEDEVGYQYSLSSESFANEDYYTFEKILIVNQEEKREQFNLYMGCCIDYQADRSSVGVQTNYIDREDLELLYITVDSFIKYAIDKHNEYWSKENLKQLKAYKIKDNKLYKNLFPNKIEEMFIVGMPIDIIVLQGSIEEKNYFSISYNAILDSICQDTIVLRDCFESKKRQRVKEIEVPINKILYLNYDLLKDSKDYLYFNEESISEDFIKYLSESEKEEFRTCTISVLNTKWKEAILNRYWMCREEHPFENRVKDRGNHENVYAAIKDIIERIQRKLV